MRTIQLVSLLAAFGAVMLGAAQAVRVEGGEVSGVVDRGIRVFMGIPYAAPWSYRPRTAPYGVLTTGSVWTAVICPPASSPRFCTVNNRAPHFGSVFRCRAR